MILSRSKFFFYVVEIPFTGREKTFCVLDYARSQWNKTVQHAFVREYENSRQQQCRFGHDTKNSKWKVVCAGENDLHRIDQIDVCRLLDGEHIEHV